MDYQILHAALSRKRSNASDTEADFAATLLKHLADVRLLPDRIDGAGNLYYSIGNSKTLFCAHIDTAHRSGGENAYRSEHAPITAYWQVSAVKWLHADGDALGADDAAGISLLCWMMKNAVPGCYVFTRGEEVGGLGASYIAENHPEFLRRFDRAICFDRRGYHDVITHQGGERCASDEFGEALANEFCKHDLMYLPSNEGVYTDCKEFIDFIPECVNISVGYFNEHGPNEKLNLHHLTQLAQAAVKIKWDDLPVKRDTDSLTLAYEDCLLEAINYSSTWELENLIARYVSTPPDEAIFINCQGIPEYYLADALEMEPLDGLKMLYELSKQYA